MKVEEKVLNQVIFGRSSYNSLRAAAVDWALLQTPHILVRLPSENKSQIFTRKYCPFAFSASCLPFLQVASCQRCPLTTVSFRFHLQLSLGNFGGMEKKWKELIAIRNYNSVWQCLWFNGAHISKLPLLSFSHQPLLPSSCKWKVPIALHSRQRQLSSGL